MPPTLALVLCTAFVLFMLRVDRKQSPEVSFAFWIPTIWFLVLSSKPVAIWFQSTGATIEEGNPLDRVFLIVMFFIGLIILVKRKFSWVNIIKENIWLLLLLSYMLLSCLLADTPFISFKRWSRQLIAVVMMFVIASEPQPWKSLESLLRRTIYILIPFSYILIHYFPKYGRLYVHHSGDLMWTGAAMHKNTLTQLCVTAIFFLIWTFIRRQQGSIIPVFRYQTYLEVFILILALMMMGGPYHSFMYSATASAAGIIGIGMLAALFWYKKRGAIPGSAILTTLTVFIIAYGTVTPMLGKLTLVDISSMVGREETLTGRTEVWNRLVPVAMNRPILGHGFNSFWTTGSRDEFNMTGAHNGFLDIILSLGLVGLGLYTIFFVSNIRKAQRVLTQNFDWGVFWICTLLMGLLSNITESIFISFTSDKMIIIICLSFLSTAGYFSGNRQDNL